MVKKGVLGAALTAGALYLAFGTSAHSYVRTAFHKVRHSAQDAVPVQFDIDRVREDVASLEGPIKENLQNFYRTQVEVETLDREIGAFQANLEGEKKAIIAMRETVAAGGVHKVGHVTYTNEEVKSELARRLDHYRSANDILKTKKESIKAKRQIMDAAKQQIVSMTAQKKEMQTKLESIEARLKLIEAKRQSSEFTVDDGGALARVKQSVNDLEKRIEVQARMAENGDFSAANGAVFIESGRDVLKEVDAEFGGECKEGTSPGKSL